jgi:hypothetical protein
VDKDDYNGVIRINSVATEQGAGSVLGNIRTSP